MSKNAEKRGSAATASVADKKKAPKPKTCGACDLGPDEAEFRPGAKNCTDHEGVRKNCYCSMSEAEFNKNYRKNVKFREGVDRLVEKLIGLEVPGEPVIEPCASAVVAPTAASGIGEVESGDEFFIDEEHKIEGYSLRQFRKKFRRQNPWEIAPPLGPLKPVPMADSKGKSRNLYWLKTNRDSTMTCRIIRRRKLSKNVRKRILKKGQIGKQETEMFQQEVSSQAAMKFYAKIKTMTHNGSLQQHVDSMRIDGEDDLEGDESESNNAEDDNMTIQQAMTDGKNRRKSMKSPSKLNALMGSVAGSSALPPAINSDRLSLAPPSECGAMTQILGPHATDVGNAADLEACGRSS